MAVVMIFNRAQHPEELGGLGPYACDYFNIQYSSKYPFPIVPQSSFQKGVDYFRELTVLLQTHVRKDWTHINDLNMSS